MNRKAHVRFLEGGNRVTCSPYSTKYDNPEFVYIENLERFNKIEQIEGQHPLLKDHHRLKISGRSFSKGILTQVLKQSEPKHPKGSAIFWIDLKSNPDFKNVDFTDWLEVFDKDNKMVFRGLIKNYDPSESFGIINSQGFSLKLENEKLSAEFIGMDIEALALLTQSAGLIPQGLPYNKTEREFIVILPIQNLITNENFTIGNVNFYQDFINLDDSIIRKSNTGRNHVAWNGNFPRAKTIIKAATFFDAIIQGYNEISKALDIIAFRTDLSFPSITIENRQFNLRFSYYKYLSKVKITKLVYCRELNSNSCTFFNIESIRENILSLNVESQKFFEESIMLFNDLISKNEPTRKERNLLQVLHWIRRSIQEGNEKDKFLGLWIAFEFLLGGEDFEKLFSEDEKTKLKVLMDISDLPENKKEAIKSKINMINDMPLMEKFKQLTAKLKIEFSDDELKMLSRMRVKRTDIIHGKQDISLNDEELNKMRTILEKILIGKISSHQC